MFTNSLFFAINTDTDVPEVDLYQLQVNTLRRYKKHYKVATRPGMNKAQLSDVIRVLFIIITFEFISKDFQLIFHCDFVYRQS